MEISLPVVVIFVVGDAFPVVIIILVVYFLIGNTNIGLPCQAFKTSRV